MISQLLLWLKVTISTPLLITLQTVSWSVVVTTGQHWFCQLLQCKRSSRSVSTQELHLMIHAKFFSLLTSFQKLTTNSYLSAKDPSLSSCAPLRQDQNKYWSEVHQTVQKKSLVSFSWSVKMVMNCIFAQRGEKKEVSSSLGTGGIWDKTSSTLFWLTGGFLLLWMSKNSWRLWSREIDSNRSSMRRPSNLRISLTRMLKATPFWTVLNRLLWRPKPISNQATGYKTKVFRKQMNQSPPLSLLWWRKHWLSNQNHYALWGILMNNFRSKIPNFAVRSSVSKFKSQVFKKPSLW